MNWNRQAGRATMVSALVLFGGGLARSASPQFGSFVTIDISGASSTSAYSINNRGAIVGNYEDGTGTHGFFRTSGGAIVTFDIPSSIGTLPVAINNENAITGSYVDAASTSHGFLLTPNQPAATFDVTGAGVGNLEGTLPVSINDKGEVAGTYRDVNLVNHGFVRQADGTIVAFDAPGASTVPLDGTIVTALGASGFVVGFYIDNSAEFHGFTAVPPEVVTVDIPGSYDEPFGGTRITAINSANTVTGYYYGTGGPGYLLANGVVTRFSVGNSVTPVSINAAGAITGGFQDSNGSHGFLRTPAGRILTFDDPAGTNETFPQSINSSGVITGYYYDANFVPHGFIFTPNNAVAHTYAERHTGFHAETGWGAPAGRESW
jgi:hypothetical protein